MSIAALIGTYGYPLVFLGAIAEGEAIVIAAGYVAHRQHMQVELVVACAALGGTVGDLGWFLLGRRFGERTLRRLPASIRGGASRARDAVQRNPIRVLLAMRFLYGMRIALPVLCGASTMRLSQFAMYNIATAIVWSAIFTGIGYGFGAAATVAIHEIERYEGFVLAAVVLLGLGLHHASKWLRPWIVPTDSASPATLPIGSKRGERREP